MEKQIFPFFSTAIANHFTSIATETSKPLRVHAAKLSASSLCCALTYLQFLCVVQSSACSPFPFVVSIHCCSGPAIYFALTSPERLRRFSIGRLQRKAISKPQPAEQKCVIFGFCIPLLACKPGKFLNPHFFAAKKVDLAGEQHFLSVFIASERCSCVALVGAFITAGRNNVNERYRIGSVGKTCPDFRFNCAHTYICPKPYSI